MREEALPLRRISAFDIAKHRRAFPAGGRIELWLPADAQGQRQLR